MKDPDFALQRRHRIVLEMLGNGDTAPVIARRLRIPVYKVQTRIKQLRRGYGVHTMHGVVAEAFRAGDLT